MQHIGNNLVPSGFHLRARVTLGCNIVCVADVNVIRMGKVPMDSSQVQHRAYVVCWSARTTIFFFILLLVVVVVLVWGGGGGERAPANWNFTSFPAHKYTASH